MEAKKLNFDEQININLSYYNSKLDLLKSIYKRTIQEETEIKLIKCFIHELEKLKILKNQEINKL